MVLFFLSFLCLICSIECFRRHKLQHINNYMNYSKKKEKTITKNKKNYDENFVETLLVSYSLYFMSSDGVIKRPNIKNIAARACISTTKLNKIFEKYNGHLFKISYYKKGARTFTDSIVLSEHLFSLIHVKKNQYRFHQKYVTEMIKTRLPKSPLATLVFYITVMHSSKDGVSTISIKKLTGIISQKYERRETIDDQLKILEIKRNLINLHEKKAENKISLKDYNEKRNQLFSEEAEILKKNQIFRKIKHYEFNDALEDNIRHAMRLLVKNNIINKEGKIFFLNLEKQKNNKEKFQNINIENVELSTTNNLSFRKEKRIKNGLFSKNQISNKQNFQKFLTSHCRTKILLGKIFKFFKKKQYEKSKDCFLKNKWLMKKTFFCQKLKKEMVNFLRENVKLRSQFHILSKYISFLCFNKKIDLAISLFENLRSFVFGKNLFEINWDKFYLLNKIQEVFPPFMLRSNFKK